MPRLRRAAIATAAALALAVGTPAAVQAAPKAIDGNAHVFALTAVIKASNASEADTVVKRIHQRLGRKSDLWIFNWGPVNGKQQILLRPNIYDFSAAALRANLRIARRVLADYGKVTTSQYYEADLTVPVAKGSAFARDDYSATMKISSMAPVGRWTWTSYKGTATLICLCRVTVAQYHAILPVFAKLAGEPVSKVKLTTY